MTDRDQMYQMQITFNTCGGSWEDIFQLLGARGLTLKTEAGTRLTTEWL